MADRSSPHYEQLGAEGQVAYEFEGRIKARGLELEADTAGPLAPEVDRIRWLRDSDGVVIAEMVASYLADTSWFQLLTHGRDGPAAPALIEVQAIDAEADGEAKLRVLAADNSDCLVDVSASPNGAGAGAAARLIDSAGRSSFLQLRGGPAAALVQYGTRAAVNSDGGGWCNYTLPLAFATSVDWVLAMNTFAGTSGAGFLDINWSGTNAFRCFVNAAGINCSCAFLAVGH